MGHTVTVRGLTIGAGVPKICVPLVADNALGLLQEARTAKGAGADLVEWRADFFRGLDDLPSLCQTLDTLRSALEELPLLFTVRTRGEGGQSPYLGGRCARLLLEVLGTGHVDLLDVELSLGDTLCRRLIRAARAENAVTVLSSHDFETTPPCEELLERVRHMRRLGGDIAKVAVMPRDPGDVLALLEATREASRVGGPLITMSMGGLGAVSRISGEFFGSAVTFGAASTASAPGQLPVTELRQIQESLHRALKALPNP